MHVVLTELGLLVDTNKHFKMRLKFTCFDDKNIRCPASWAVTALSIFCNDLTESFTGEALWTNQHRILLHLTRALHPLVVYVKFAEVFAAALDLLPLAFAHVGDFPDALCLADEVELFVFLFDDGPIGVIGA